jgi:plasmid stabilization system protein ParE
MRRALYRPAARVDIRHLLKTSNRAHGTRAQRDYKALLERAIGLLREDPNRVGVKTYDDLPEGPSFFHLRHARVRGVAPKAPRHFIVFTYDAATIVIVRVLHEAMDCDAPLREDNAEA